MKESVFVYKRSFATYKKTPLIPKLAQIVDHMDERRVACDVAGGVQDSQAHDSITKDALVEN